MNIKRIHHVAIIGSNYEKSKTFYVETLGLKVLNEHFREERQSYKLDLQIGDSQIELFSFPNPPQRQTYPEATGLRHLALSTTSIEDVRTHLLSKGVQLQETRTDEITHKKFFFFSDPDGLPIEIYEE